MLSSVTCSTFRKLFLRTLPAEHAQTDEFLLNLGAKEIGDVRRIDIGFASKQSAGGAMGSILGMDWCLHSCELVHTNTQRRGFFPYDGWLKKDSKRVVLEEAQPSVQVQYKVVVKTSDLRCGCC